MLLTSFLVLELYHPRMHFCEPVLLDFREGSEDWLLYKGPSCPSLADQINNIALNF